MFLIFSVCFKYTSLLSCQRGIHHLLPISVKISTKRSSSRIIDREISTVWVSIFDPYMLV